MESTLHPRNRHHSRYDFAVLTKESPELAKFVSLNKFGDESIDFANPAAVKSLNQALLKHFYQIDHWDIPEGYLCPPIPGRADYLHYAADLLASCNDQIIPKGPKVKVLDIGIGANCVYPIIGHQEYGWGFVGSEIDPVALKSAKNIANINPSLKNAIEVRLQTAKNTIFKGIIHKQERFDLSICNPPFHASAAAALAGSQRKVRNLGNKNYAKPTLNFGGQASELWTEGGEVGFISKMIEESKLYAQQCFWFTTLVSKSENLPAIYAILNRAGVVETRTNNMTTGNKVSRIVAWTFLSVDQQKVWVKNW
ncbi:23S rRNA (adenine(1618)-N(6))-methyltransferase RlmF [Pedobacter insulae]|uniref:Ribosomal RNA large subunit methyltransferase F n=1 Tax=Pedobacter insulae TaxID=414048 RepID=A0A1I3ACL0_9SPHI|nr:23S rRNA (adenine(1618)-N(6))-methyltransferase RlmF [Pedobacter insulae]SFH47824.1 23S rRNA m(6)A-1618 methyltransferase [Pedobacter insulae]